MKYILGLDVGIGSVGWALIRNDEKSRIEDFGVRLFDSSEYSNGKNRKSQDRRLFRAARRLVRRRSHRKARLKQHLERIGFVPAREIEKFFEQQNPDLLALRVRGLTQQLTPVELAACLIHISNHRGYQDFYEVDLAELSAAEREEYEQEHEGIARVAALMQAGGYRSAAEMYLKDPTFRSADGAQTRSYRHHPYRETRYPISREMLRREAAALLDEQGKYYPCLLAQNPAVRTSQTSAMSNRDILLDIIFKQRDFEDGPGDTTDPSRRYTGFLDSLGQCPFYHSEKRGFRCTATADLYALVNVLSQYRYICTKTGELALPPALARELLDRALAQAGLKQTDIKAIAKTHGVQVDMKTSEKTEPLSGCIRYLRVVKPILEAAGLSWQTALGEDPCCTDTLVNQIGTVLSQYQTPRRRLSELKKIDVLGPDLASRLSKQKISGTARVSEHYMKDAIEAFCRGESYGNFQARRNADAAAHWEQTGTQSRKLPPFGPNEEFAKNPVVLRSLNETRKVVNAIVEKYGSPWAINVEVASDLGRSYEERREVERSQAQNEKQRLQQIGQIAELMGIEADRVTGPMLERYRLGEIQGWKCLYSGKAITDKRAAIDPRGRAFEVDHIVPFSLVLDNTLHNKALVYMDENQKKGQRTPLMYLPESEKAGYIGRVNLLAKNHVISDRKRQYLLLRDFGDTELLSEWKSRNLNDTRYMAKYLVGYLSRNLQFAPAPREPRVFAVKGSLTSHFRRIWLNKDTWGKDEKDATRAQTNLHHAVDAVVIANISRATAQIAEDNMRLNRILRASHGEETPEYRAQLKTSLETLQKYYGVPFAEGEKYLRRKGRISAILANLNVEVDFRFQDRDEALFRSQVSAYYADDPQFAAALHMPLVSYKPENKYQGPVTTQNAISVRQIDGVWHKMERKSVLALKNADLAKLCTNDGDLRASLSALLEGAGGKTVEEILRQQGRESFVTQRGRAIRKVTLVGDEWAEPHIKQIGESNYSALDTRSYHCVEVYRDLSGKTCVRGIMAADVLRQDKKLGLRVPTPAGYAEHLMYLFKNDYITVANSRSGRVLFAGFYKSPSGIKQAKFWGVPQNAAGSVPFIISGVASVKKYEVSILGEKGGEVKCGAPLLLQREKK